MNTPPPSPTLVLLDSDQPITQDEYQVPPECMRSPADTLATALARLMAQVAKATPQQQQQWQVGCYAKEDCSDSLPLIEINGNSDHILQPQQFLGYAPKVQLSGTPPPVYQQNQQQRNLSLASTAPSSRRNSPSSKAALQSQHQQLFRNGFDEVSQQQFLTPECTEDDAVSQALMSFLKSMQSFTAEVSLPPSLPVEPQADWLTTFMGPLEQAAVLAKVLTPGDKEASWPSSSSLDGLPSLVEGDDEFDVQRRSLFNGDMGLNLSLFKGLKCHAESGSNCSSTHDRKNCPFYHSNRDRRRLPVFYKAEQCEAHFDFDNEGSVCVCVRGDDCDRCHNRHELLYHPKIYKQRFCSSYKTMQLQSPSSSACHRGRFCAFAHSREEIRCNLFSQDEENRPAPEFFMNRFKTFWCPYGIQHDWHGCLYAHTYQDCRRSPAIGYGSEPCPYWQKDLHSADYHKRCPFGARCPYAHGSKEQLYHPAYYKSMPCADFKARRSCPRGSFCAFYHDTAEKRRGAEDAEVVYDYSRPVGDDRIVFLQPNFMAPPLFNLDDFEAFGHYSRAASGETLSRKGDEDLLSMQKQRQGSGRRRRNNQSGLCRPQDQRAVQRRHRPK